MDGTDSTTTLFSFPGEFDPYFYLLESREIYDAAVKTGFLESRKANRGNDFISRMLNYSDQHPGEFTDGDLIKIIVTHINGGFHESAFQVLGEGIRLLISTGQYQQLVEDPSKATACVDEILRWSCERRSVVWIRAACLHGTCSS